MTLVIFTHPFSSVAIGMSTCVACWSLTLGIHFLQEIMPGKNMLEIGLSKNEGSP